MANPIPFKPQKVDPRVELENRLAAAPIEHAEALLVAYDLLGEAHAKGLLDLLLGAVGSKNEIFAKIAEYAKEPVSTQALRNAIAIGRLLGSIDPNVVLRLVESLTPPVEQLKQPHPGKPRKTPSLWALAKRIRSEDARRGLDAITNLLTGLGKSMR